MKFEEYKIKFSPNSVGKYDITPIYVDYTLFESLIHDLSAPFTNVEIDKIVGIDALGFILSTAISFQLMKGLVLVRKEGKIPIPDLEKVSRTFIDYSNNEKKLELNKSLIAKNDKILIVDDWVETGLQVKAVISMIEELGAQVVGISCVGADRNSKTEELFEKYNLRALGTNV